MPRDDARLWVAGSGMTRFGRHESDLVSLALESAHAAMKDAGIRPVDVDALYVGTFLAQSVHGRGVFASTLATSLGVPSGPTTVVEGACASGGIAVRHGGMACLAGEAEVALCVGVEHMTGVSTSVATDRLNEALDPDSDRAVGLTFPGFFGLVADAYLHEYGATTEDLAQVSVKNRRAGATNPQAMFTEPVSMEDVLRSRLIADPLRLLECSPISDGAASVVVTAGSRPPSWAPEPVKIAAIAQSSGPSRLSDIDDLLTFKATTTAAAKAYESAGIQPDDLDVVELHDCFSIAEVIDSEDLGLLPKGEGAPRIAAGETDVSTDGTVVNPSGGLLSRGHPVGATGIAQIHEIVQQLRGRAANQVADARLGLAHNLGGTGATATVTILEGAR